MTFSKKWDYNRGKQKIDLVSKSVHVVYIHIVQFEVLFAIISLEMASI